MDQPDDALTLADRAKPVRPRRVKVLGIPAPWSGDLGSGQGRRAHPHLYRAWWLLYLAVRRLEHRLGMHHWDQMWLLGLEKCDWCGQTRRRI
jgi:hypothetical protein